MIRFELKGSKNVERELGRAANELAAQLRRWLHWSSKKVLRRLQRAFSGEMVKVRTGRARRSLRDRVDDRKLVARVGSNLIYMRMLEHGTKGLPGGVLKPKRARVLTVPLKAARTEAGASYRAWDYKERYAKTFWWRSRKSGKLILLGVAARAPSRRAREKRPVALFLGLRQVRIKGRRPFGRVEREVAPELGHEANRVVARALRIRAG